MTREFQFYIVPTPIGNIQDITYRAVEILKTVDIIACEDTRVTQKLLYHYNIRTKCVSYHKYNERERVEFFLRELKDGKRIALVSDAGTPRICDPGEIIIKELIMNNITFTALPGASAVTTFLSLIPRCGEEFTFIGFIPRTEKQITELAVKYSNLNLAFYDSPERIIRTLETIKSVRPNAVVSVGRELTKLFEEIKTGAVDEVIGAFKSGVKGEIVCMLYRDVISDEIQLEGKIKALKSKGFKDKEISVILSTLYGLNKNQIYKKSLDM